MKHISLGIVSLLLYTISPAFAQEPIQEQTIESCSAMLDTSLERILFEEQEVSPLCYALPVSHIAENITFAQKNELKRTGENEWTVMVYMAAVNDLSIFAARNIRQMAAIGSRNPYLTIIVHLDIILNNNYKVTRRYLIENNKITHLNAHDAVTQSMDSGDPKTVISFCEWGISQFRAKHYALFFWNHGTGILDPERGRILDPSLFFTLNPETHKWDLDRSVGYFDLIEQASNDLRGACWDDKTGNYLNNQKFMTALDYVCTTLLQGKKLDIIGFDACLMSMLEVANIMKRYAHVMVSSQEVELGTGWDYSRFLEPLSQRIMTREELGATIVSAYNETYKQVTDDYTLSAINLDEVDIIEQHVNSVAISLKKCLAQQLHNSVINSIKASRNKVLCTHFEEPTYVDLHHWVTNLLTNMQHFALRPSAENNTLLATLKQDALALKGSIEKVVFASCTGKKLNKAKGISIYFPEKFIFKSYVTCPFAQHNEWRSFLELFVRS